MTRTSRLTSFSRWLIGLGLVFIVSAFGYTLAVKSTLNAHRSAVTRLARTHDSLQSLVADPGNEGSRQDLTVDLRVARDNLATANARAGQREEDWNALWRLNGRGPLLVAMGMILLGMGLRLRRFDQTGF